MVEITCDVDEGTGVFCLYIHSYRTDNITCHFRVPEWRNVNSNDDYACEFSQQLTWAEYDSNKLNIHFADVLFDGTIPRVTPCQVTSMPSPPPFFLFLCLLKLCGSQE